MQVFQGQAYASIKVLNVHSIWQSPTSTCKCQDSGLTPDWLQHGGVRITKIMATEWTSFHRSLKYATFYRGRHSHSAQFSYAVSGYEWCSDTYLWHYPLQFFIQIWTMMCCCTVIVFCCMLTASSLLQPCTPFMHCSGPRLLHSLVCQTCAALLHVVFREILCVLTPQGSVCVLLTCIQVVALLFFF